MTELKTFGNKIIPEILDGEIDLKAVLKL